MANTLSHPYSGALKIVAGRIATAPLTAAASEATLNYATAFNETAGATINFTTGDDVKASFLTWTIFNAGTEGALFELDDTGDFIPLGAGKELTFTHMRRDVEVKYKRDASATGDVSLVILVTF